jgi:hypothetical protein
VTWAPEERQTPAVVGFAGGKGAAGFAVAQDVGTADAGAGGEVVAPGVAGAPLNESDVARDSVRVASPAGDLGEHRGA